MSILGFGPCFLVSHVHHTLRLLHLLSEALETDDIEIIREIHSLIQSTVSTILSSEDLQFKLTLFLIEYAGRRSRQITELLVSFGPWSISNSNEEMILTTTFKEVFGLNVC